MLGLLLFILYTHDMWFGLEDMLVSYAADATLLARIPSPNMRSDVTESLNLLSVTPGVRGRFRTVTTSGRLGRFSSITFFSFFFLAVITLMIVFMLLFFSSF